MRDEQLVVHFRIDSDLTVIPCGFNPDASLPHDTHSSGIGQPVRGWWSVYRAGVTCPSCRRYLDPDEVAVR